MSKTICSAVFLVLLATGTGALSADNKRLDDLEERMDAAEFQGAPTAADSANREIGHLLFEFRDEWRDSLAEMKFLRKDINLNTHERTANTRQIGINRGDIKSNSAGISLNTGLLIVLAGLIGWIVRKMKSNPDKKKKEKSRIITGR